MGTVKVEITLKNLSDVSLANYGHITEADVHAETVEAVVDTGAMTLVINEKLREKLALKVTERKFVRVADGSRVECVLTEPVEICWKDRSAVQKAVVLPNAPVILLGVTPLEIMDLMVDPVRLELTGAHGDEWTEWLYGHSFIDNHPSV